MGIDWQRFGPELKARRQRAGWTQAELATRLGVAWNTVLRLEVGNRRPSLDLLDKLSEAFECSVCDLLPETKAQATRPKGGR